MCPQWNNCQLQKIVSIYEIFVVFIYVLLIFHTCSLYTCSLYAVPCATLLYCTLNLVHLLSVYFLIPKFFQGTFSLCNCTCVAHTPVPYLLISGTCEYTQIPPFVWSKFACSMHLFVPLRAGSICNTVPVRLLPERIKT